MKLLTSASLAVLIFGAGKLLASDSLEGQVFEGNMESAGQIFTHSLKFTKDWKVIDNSPTWFGKEANVCNYGLDWKGCDDSQLNEVTIICNGRVKHYKALQEGSTITLEGDYATLAKKAN